MQNTDLVIRYLGCQPYKQVWQAMQQFTETRQDDADQLWVVEHPPVFTQGLAGKAEHILNPQDIPVIQVDRGGQVTYHGPGQLVIYPLIHIKRAEIGIRDLVTALEQSVIDMLKQYTIDAYARKDAPGVYIDEAKIASLGLRIRKGSSFHGLALNVNMDLKPFQQINPCGYANMPITQCIDQKGPQTVDEAAQALLPILCQKIGKNYTISTSDGIPFQP